MLVSVIIPTYNRAATILRSVESALRQTYQNLEIIVVDDGSTDGTGEILRSNLQEIKVVYQRNSGPSAARNAGIKASNGDIVSFLDSDDVWHPEKIERQVGIFLTAGESVTCCVCNASFMDASGKQTTSFDVARIQTEFKHGLWVNPSEVLATRFLLFNQVVAIRRSVIDLVGGFNEELWVLEDYELALRLSVTGIWGIIQEALVAKDNGTDGIGVQAMREHAKLQRTYVKVMEEFLAQCSNFQGKSRRLAERALQIGRWEMQLGDWTESRNLTASVAGQLGLLGIRGANALRRRMPGWPKAEIQQLRVPERELSAQR